MFQEKRLLLAVVVSSIVGHTGAALAQESKEVTSLRGANFEIEEIVVTARRKEESLSTVPIAIDAMTEKVILEKGVSNLEDVAKYSPGLTFEVGVLPNDTRPVIRGLSINRGRPNVGILVDGIDVSSETLTVSGGGTSANLNLMDLQRVEVVKGPQSPLYGRAAFGGAINYVTSRPDGETKGKISVDVHEHDFYKVNAGFSMPLVEDKVAASVNFTTSDFDGYYQNPNTGGDLGGTSADGVAVALNFTPSETFSAYARAEYSEEDYTPRAVVMKQSLSHISSPFDFFLSGSLGKDASLIPIPGGAFGGAIPETPAAACASATPFAYTVGGRTACATMLTGDVGDADESMIDQSANPETGKDFNGTEIENLRVSLELAWDLDGVHVTSLTGLSSNETNIQEDFDLTDFDLQSLGPGSANFDPSYLFVDPFGSPPTFVPNLTPLNNNPFAAFTQVGANTNTDTDFESDQFSQEIRITGGSDTFSWLVSGLYWTEDMDAVMNQMWWMRESADVDYWNSTFSRFADPTCALPGNVSTCQLFRGLQTRMQPNPVPMSRDTDHWSVAASLIFNVADNQRLTVEGRYLEEEIEYRSLPIDTFINGFLGMPYFDPATFSFVPKEQKRTIKDDAFVPRVSYDWQTSNGSLVYASYSEGFKPGGIATTDGNGDISTGEYKPEELQAYEIGMKTSLLGNRLSLEGAIFLNDYTNQQVPFFVPNSVGVTNVSVTNAGESEVKGFELSAIHRPSENWTFTAAYTRADTEYEDFNISDVGSPGTYDKVQSGNIYGDFRGKEFTNSAKNAANLGIRYEGTTSNGLDYFSELSGRYQSKRYLDQGNLAYLPSYWLTDFTTGVSKDNWDVILYVDNLTDDDKVKSGLGNVSYGFLAGGQIPAFGANLTLPQPRTIGLRASYEF